MTKLIVKFAALLNFYQSLVKNWLIRQKGGFFLYIVLEN